MESSTIPAALGFIGFGAVVQVLMPVLMSVLQVVGGCVLVLYAWERAKWLKAADV